MIEIDNKKIIKRQKNFWNHIHFHPTDAIEDDWGKAILERIADDRVAQTVRLYAMLEDVVFENPDGSLRYDFSLPDTRLDYLTSNVTSPPKDYGIWEEICYRFTKHITVQWLSDDSASAFVTGITIPVDGGFLCRSGV